MRNLRSRGALSPGKDGEVSRKNIRNQSFREV